MSVTGPEGFVAAGVHCGIKPAGNVLDLALVATSDHAAVPAAAVFTSNLATAAPVQVSRAHLLATGGLASAVILNSGNANAATGAPGLADATDTCGLVGERLGCPAEQVLVCSTGLIGIPLPMPALRSGVAPLVEALSAERKGAAEAAEAILTTDTLPKEVELVVDGVTVGGMAKGAAMLAPNMATMLAVLTTDARVEPAELRRALGAAVDESFNQLSVDGSQSTNDTVVVLASGRAGPIDSGRFREVLADACYQLASSMAADAEGATKLVAMRITGAASPGDARRAARRVAESQLVKCSLYGQDPYWGRIVSELGSSGAAFDPDRVSVAYGDVVVCRGGVAVPHDATALARHLKERDITVTADLGLGEAVAVVHTADLTPSYIAENMRTS